MTCEIKIEKFEGPLDLLLHLIRKHEMDIYDIPVVEITTQYLAYIDEMKSFNLDIAGEYLLMAATLLHIKSQMLLPQPEEESVEEEELDPRAELVRRLLEYQRYKDAAQSFQSLSQLDRDVFCRVDAAQGDELPHHDDQAPELEAVGLFELVEIFRELLAKAPHDSFHEVTAEQLSVTERIHVILNALQDSERVTLRELVPKGEKTSRHELVVLFLALLELAKMRLVKIYQGERYSDIWLFPAVADELEPVKINEETLGYA